MKYLKSKKGSLENSIISVWSEAASKIKEGSKEEYQKFFNSALKKFKIDSPADLKSDAEKKKFFNYVDKNYKGEKDEQVTRHIESLRPSKMVKERMEKGIDKLPRQFLNPDKEVMILKKGKVIVIDKKDQDRYMKQGWELAEITKEGTYFIAKDMSKLKKRMQKKMKYDATNFRVAIRHIGDDEMIDELQTLKPNEDMRPIIKKAMKRLGIKENFEVGTKARRDHTIETTPGQSKEDFEKQVEVMHKKKNSMREALAKMWGIEEKNNKNPFDNVKEKKYSGKEGKTMTGKPETKVEVEPEVNEKKK